MKVIFIDDVPNVARVGQTREVANGYARNFLFPRKLAVLANSQAAAAIDAHLKKLVKQCAAEEAEMAALAKKIEGKEITLRAKVGENDKLYGSITAADIAEELSKVAGFLIDKKNVVIAEPIKQVGVCDVTIKFVHDIAAVIQVCVMDENDTGEKPVKAVKAEKPEAKKEKAAAEEGEASAEPKKAKAAKKPKAEKPAAEATEADAEAVAEEKPAKEKKAKAEKAVKEEAPAEEEAPAAEKKEKKPRAKAKKEEAAE